ncbi:type II and III secretion system protein family protein [Vibrio sp. S4M6]|uniref:type II and III secretion system protein family protein n=1 Tax=Vibrio sinus TaxID=2946865 RepID=UPI00202A00E2|nr:type II and III secretion system protein family protein [Vibrio sinus]MCL9780815.1 type II and III secretion system protein family protein [Vibrio sinus]
MFKLAKQLLAALVLTTVSFFAAASGVINLAKGNATTINVNQDVSSVFIASPKIADYQVIDKKKVVVYGKSIGRTSIMVFGKSGTTLANRTVIVNKSLTKIQQYIAIKFPNANINVFNVGDQVVLSGTVATETEKSQIEKVVGNLLARKAKEHVFEYKNTKSNTKEQMDYMTRTSYEGIVNNIEVAATKQVNVKLSIAEVSQSFMEDIGFKYGSNSSSPGQFISPINGFNASNLLAVINASHDDTVGKVLAEPNLSVISGETANFLVGGQLPVVYTVNNSTSVEYKDYGIQLHLMAKVKSDDNIRLTLAPEVSSLDTTYENQTYSLPALKTRREKTTVELGDGQSFVLGGLLSTEEIESLSKVPLLGDIPILGTLFRDAATHKKKTELVIVATVNLVKPVKPSQIQLPEMQKTTTLSRFFGLNDNKTAYPKASEKLAKELLATGGFKK